MSSNRRSHIAIADPSVIVRSGIVSVLKRLSGLHVNIIEIPDITHLNSQLYKWKPDILIVNPAFLGIFSLSQIRNDVRSRRLKYVALQSALTDAATLNLYDETISIYDSAETIKDKINALCTDEDNSQTDSKQELSFREKEIIVCVVKGMTNKQIADYLCLSAHTVITHRRNIANKLQIHSPSGLTIYAIVNKLVELNDVKESISNEEV